MNIVASEFLSLDGVMEAPEKWSLAFWNDLVVQDRLIASTLTDHGPVLTPSRRSVQRRYREVTGLSATMIRQIDRARRAGALLRTGVPTADVAHLLGYADQPHLTRAMRRYVGQTPGQIVKGSIPLGRI